MILVLFLLFLIHFGTNLSIKKTLKDFHSKARFEPFLKKMGLELA